MRLFGAFIVVALPSRSRLQRPMLVRLRASSAPLAAEAEAREEVPNDRLERRAKKLTTASRADWV